MFWGRFLVRFEFLGSELTGEGPTPVGKLHGCFSFRVFSLGFRTDRRRYPTPVGESRHEFACICLDFCDL